MALILSTRTLSQPVWVALGRPNAALWRMLAATAVVLVLVLGLAPLRELFQLAPLTWSQAGEVVVVAGVALVILEALKALRALSALSVRPQ